MGLIDSNNLTSWKVIKILSEVKIWGESAVIVNGYDVLLISRTNKNFRKAMVATSKDYDQNWSDLQLSKKLPIIDSEP